MYYWSAGMFLLFCTAFLATVCGGLICMPCYDEEECNIEPVGCVYGVVRNYCGRKECAKGPNENCGGPGDRWGKCGEGMHCKCNRCSGCSAITVECSQPYDTTKCINRLFPQLNGIS